MNFTEWKAENIDNADADMLDDLRTDLRKLGLALAEELKAAMEPVYDLRKEITEANERLAKLMTSESVQKSINNKSRNDNKLSAIKDRLKILRPAEEVAKEISRELLDGY